MDPRYARPASPGSRRLVQPGRSSTGTLVYPSTFDPYYAPTRSSRDSIAGPRSSADRIIAPRITSRTFRDDPLPPSRLRNDHIVSPRRATLDPLNVPSRRPLTVVPTSSPNRYRPVISSATEKPSSPFVKTRPRDDESYYLQPASSSTNRREHYRNYSADSKDVNRHLVAGGERDRLDRGGYGSSGIGGGRSGYNMDLPVVRHPKDKDDRDDGYEYTDRKEQVYRDTAPRPRPRRESDSGRRERPISMTGLEDYLPRTGGYREPGPPVTTRGFDKLNGSGTTRTEYRIPREPDPASRDHVSGKSRDDTEGLSRRRSTKVPVSLHQDPGDGYNSYRDDRKDPLRERRHSTRRAGSLDRANEDRGLGIRGARDDDIRHERDRDDLPRRHHEPVPGDDRRAGKDRDRRTDTTQRPDRADHHERDHRPRDETRKEQQEDSRHAGDIALGAAGVAAAGLVAEGARSRHHDKESMDAEPPNSPKARLHDREAGHLAVIADPADTSDRGEDISDEDRRERRRRRREREREREAREGETREEERLRGRHDELTLPRDNLRRENGSYDRGERHTRDPREAVDEPRKSHRHRRHHHRTSDEASYDEDSSDDDPRERRPTQVRVVSPAREKTPEAKPKGILRQPREKFPEDPAPVREGVAPLKDAGKKGIPPNARWTKIDRKLVNPEALEMGNERYEERIDYVIVLRVLTKEEIEQYAKKTQEIRDERHYEDKRRRLKALEDAERKYETKAPKSLEYRPQLNSKNNSYEDSNSNHYDSSRDSKKDRRDKTTAPQPVLTLPATSPDSALKEDPLHPETYNEYQRNPALPARPDYAQAAPRQEYPPQPPRPDYRPQPSEFPPPPSSKEPSPQPLPLGYPYPQPPTQGYPRPPYPDYSQYPPQSYPQPPYPEYSQVPPQGYPQPPYQGYPQPPYQEFMQPSAQDYQPPPPPPPPRPDY